MLTITKEFDHIRFTYDAEVLPTDTIKTTSISISANLFFFGKN